MVLRLNKGVQSADRGRFVLPSNWSLRVLHSSRGTLRRMVQADGIVSTSIDGRVSSVSRGRSGSYVAFLYYIILRFDGFLMQ